jgi:phospho-N-acetylmuramoyl-pentapeptide-transferase
VTSCGDPRGFGSTQAVVALSFCYWVCTQLAAGGLAAGWATATLVGSLYLPLGAFYWPLGVFVMTAQSNAVNLTGACHAFSPIHESPLSHT